ncbi:hypothetical protein AB1L30_05705 [Bremerella sp. JC817]
MGNASVSFVLCHEEFDHRLVDSCFQEESEALTDLEIRYDLSISSL